MSKKPTEASARGKAKTKTPQDTAFRRWLEEQLHQKYDEVLKEPIPDDLLTVLKKEDGSQPADDRQEDDDRRK